MFTEVRKINLIEAVMKLNNESTLIELETVIKKSKTKKKEQVRSANDFFIILNTRTKKY